MHPVTSRIKLLSHGLDVLPTLNEDFRIRLQHIESLARGGGEHGWESGGVGVCCCSNTLMSYNVCGACAESTTSAERPCEGADNHIDL